MLRIALTDRLRRRQETNTYRQVLMAALAADSSMQILPALRTLPCSGLLDHGQAVPMDMALVQQGLLLRGKPGSGRRLVIAQLAHAWLAGGTFEKPMPLPIDLLALDDGSSSPNALMTALVAGLSRGKLNDELSWLLLVSGWEDLPSTRRVLWRSALIAHMYPASVRLGIIVAPLDEAPWPGLTTITLAPAGPAQPAIWLQQLAPDLDPALLGPMPTLFDCALAAWLSTRGPLPASQVAREQRALALMQPRHSATTGALAAISSGMSSFYAQRAALYKLAVQIVDTAGYEHVLEHRSRTDLALLVAGLAPESDGLLRVLARAGRGDAHIMLAAGRCLAEQPPRSPALTCLIIRALGILAAASRPESAHAGVVLAACLPALDRALNVLVGRKADRLIQAVLQVLPSEAASPRMAHLAYDPATTARIGWWCATRLAAQLDATQVSAPEAPQSLARWAFVQALRGPSGHALLLRESPAQALRALALAAPVYREPAAIALLTHADIPLLVRLSALLLIEPRASAAGAALLRQLACDPAHAMRIAALTRLVQQSRRQGALLAAQIAGDAAQAWETRQDAIRFLARLPARIAGPALIVSAMDPSLPLHVRIEALHSRHAMRNPHPQLIALARNQLCDPIIRTAALRLLAAHRPAQQRRPLHRAWHGRRVRMRSYRLTHTLAWLLDDLTTPGMVAVAACDLLVAHGGSIAAITLIGVVERAPADLERTYAAISGLGSLTGERVIQCLATLLGAGALVRLQQTIPALLLRLPATQVAESGELPLPLQQSLQSALTLCLRVADRPTTVQEFLLTAADRLRTAAAQALARIGGSAARSALLDGLIAGESATATPALLDALVHVCGPDDAQPLMQLICNAKTSTRVRWLVAQRLSEHPAALGFLLEGVSRGDLDVLTRATLAAALGRRQVASAFSPLALLAQDRAIDRHLREQALVGLGALGNTNSDALLLRIAADPTELPRLRGIAAAQISPAMDAATHWALRNLLHQERATVDVLIGGLIALGRTRDREALPLIMQYSLDQRSDVARAAIDALVTISDSTITSVLVGLSQKTHLDRMLRLHAVGALLRLGDPDGPLLLRDYLHGSSVPLQLQALEQLIGAGASAAQLLLLASDPSRSVAFRLRALDRLGRVDSAEPLWPILEERSEPAEVRGRAAQILATVGGTKAHELLVLIAARYDDHPGVRLCCIEALLQRRDPLAAPVLARIATASELTLIRDQAASALLALMIP